MPNLSTAVFENVGGVVFVPVRYASPHVPELGLPRGSVASWFGETGIQTERGVREAALSVAWNWSEALWGTSNDLVPFGLFEDVGGAGGQVTGVIAPPPSASPATDTSREFATAARGCIDLFAGAGGLAIGLGEAGFEHIALLEHDARKVATLVRNGLNQTVCADVGGFDYSPWRGTVAVRRAARMLAAHLLRHGLVVALLGALDHRRVG